MWEFWYFRSFYIDTCVTLLFRTRQFRCATYDHGAMQYLGNRMRVFVTLTAIMVSPRIVYLVMIVRLSPFSHKIHVQIYKRRYLSTSKATHFSPLSSQIRLAGIRVNQHSQNWFNHCAKWTMSCRSEPFRTPGVFYVAYLIKKLILRKFLSTNL